MSVGGDVLSPFADEDERTNAATCVDGSAVLLIHK